MAANEAWMRYMKEHPDPETLRATGCPIYNQLHIIFAEPGISGRCYGSNNDIEEIPGSLHSPHHTSVSPEELSPSEPEKHADLTSRERGRKGMEEAFAKGIIEMAVAAKFMAEATCKHSKEFSLTNASRH